MNITILIERHGIRDQVEVKSWATRIPGIHRILWYGTRTREDRGDYVSLVHVLTGRALNKSPLTVEESDHLLGALLECEIEWDRIVDGSTGERFYADRLTDEAEQLAGRF